MREKVKIMIKKLRETKAFTLLEMAITETIQNLK